MPGKMGTNEAIDPGNEQSHSTRSPNDSGNARRVSHDGEG